MSAFIDMTYHHTQKASQAQIPKNIRGLVDKRQTFANKYFLQGIHRVFVIQSVMKDQWLNYRLPSPYRTWKWKAGSNYKLVEFDETMPGFACEISLQVL